MQRYARDYVCVLMERTNAASDTVSSVSLWGRDFNQSSAGEIDSNTRSECQARLAEMNGSDDASHDSGAKTCAFANHRGARNLLREGANHFGHLRSQAGVDVDAIGIDD